MATTDLNKLKEEAEDSGSKKLAKADKEELANVEDSPSGLAPLGGVEGDVDMSDLKLPRINLVQKISDLADDFPVGSFVLDQHIKLVEEGENITTVVLRIKKQYQEDVEFGEDARIFDTRKEVIENGGSLTWGAENYYKSLAHMQLFIKAPDGLDESEKELFPYVYETKGEKNVKEKEHWAMVAYTVTSSGYNSFAKVVLSHGMQQLRKGLHHGRYLLSSKEKKNAKNKWHIPVPSYVGKNDPEFIAFVEAAASGEIAPE